LQWISPLSLRRLTRIEAARICVAPNITALTQSAKNSLISAPCVVDGQANSRNRFVYSIGEWGKAAMDSTLRDLTVDELERVVGGDAPHGAGAATEEDRGCEKTFLYRDWDTGLLANSLPVVAVLGMMGTRNQPAAALRRFPLRSVSQFAHLIDKVLNRPSAPASCA
jgi:hypothetical protein